VREVPKVRAPLVNFVLTFVLTGHTNPNEQYIFDKKKLGAQAPAAPPPKKSSLDAGLERW
jgi:hypothetical protein